MKEPANDCNLTYPIFNISSLNSKMTRYDPNTVPIMQHWSKWPFHTEHWKKKKINPAPPPLFPPFCLAISLHTKVPPAVAAACTYIYTIYTKQNAARQINWPRHGKAISPCPVRLILLFTSMLCFSLCLFVFLPPTCVSLPRRLALSAARHPAMLNPRSRDRWRKRGQTSLPISRGAPARSHHNG